MEGKFKVNEKAMKASSREKADAVQLNKGYLE